MYHGSSLSLKALAAPSRSWLWCVSTYSVPAGVTVCLACATYCTAGGHQAWCATNPNVSTVILGATRLSQLEETLVAVELIPKLTPAVLEEIEAALGTKPEMSEGMQQVVAIRGPPARL